MQRNRRLARFELRNSRFSRVKTAYFIKNVFYGEYVDTYDYYKIHCSFKNEREDYAKHTEGFKSLKSLFRAKERIFRIVQGNIVQEYKPIFFTLTSADQETDLRESNKKIKAFIRRLNDYLGYNLKYIVVPERHKSGAFHYHGVFFNVPYVNVVFFRHNIWKYGYVDLKIPRKIKSVARYLTKYFTKDTLTNLGKNDKSYFTSRNLVLPSTELTNNHPSGTLSIEEIIKTKQGIIIKYKYAQSTTEDDFR